MLCAGSVQTKYMFKAKGYRPEGYPNLLFTWICLQITHLNSKLIKQENHLPSLWPLQQKEDEERSVFLWKVSH